MTCCLSKLSLSKSFCLYRQLTCAYSKNKSFLLLEQERWITATFITILRRSFITINGSYSFHFSSFRFGRVLLLVLLPVVRHCLYPNNAKRKFLVVHVPCDY